MVRKNLWLSGLCLLALGLVGLAGGGSPDGGAVAVADREAQVIRGGQYCPMYSTVTHGNICTTACPYVLCVVYYNCGAPYNVDKNDCAWPNSPCASCYKFCAS